MAEPQLVPDGQTSFEGGQDTSLPSSRLQPNRYAAGVNFTTFKGVLRPRYGYERKKLQFPAGGYSYRFNKIVDFKYLFESGKFQAMVPYQVGKINYLIIVISGVIFLVNVKNFKVNVLTQNRDTQLNESSDRVNHTIAGRFVVLWDFPNRPIIIDGHVARRSNVNNDEVPAANLGAYNQSRLFFANYGNEFSAGDPVGNDLTPFAPVTVTEITLEGSPYFGDVYQMPSRYNSPVTAMGTLPPVDDNTGIGTLITGSKKEIWAFDTTQGRDTWLTGRFGKQISDNAGIAGARSFTNIGTDVFFTSIDGQLRALSVSRDEQRKWARVPMNVEVENWISNISPELIKYSALTYYKNKIFWTARPYRIPALRLNGQKILDVAHSGMLVLETDNVSRMGVDAAPAWAGLWTGLRPMDMCVVEEQMFVMSKEYYSKNALYLVDPELRYDKAERGQRRQIKGTLYTREHFFNDMFSSKDLNNVQFGITNISGKFSLNVEWKPAHSSNFQHWTHFEHEVPVEYRNIKGGNIPEKTTLAFKELRFGFPDTEETHPITGDSYSTVKRVQLRIKIQGDSWQFNEYKLEATAVEESDTEYLDPKELPVEAENKYFLSDWEYEEFGL